MQRREQMLRLAVAAAAVVLHSLDFQAEQVEMAVMHSFAYIVFDMNSLAIIRESDGKVVTFVRPDQPQGWKPPEGTRAGPDTELPDNWEQAEPEVIPYEPITAEAWVEAEGFYGNRPTTLLYLKLKMDATAKFSPALNAVQGWLDQMIVAGVTNPNETRDDWASAPYSFEQASAEALEILANA
jgi:hypothetical protein